MAIIKINDPESHGQCNLRSVEDLGAHFLGELSGSLKVLHLDLTQILQMDHHLGVSLVPVAGKWVLGRGDRVSGERERGVRRRGNSFWGEGAGC